MEREVAVRNSQATRDAAPVGAGVRGPQSIEIYLQSAGGDDSALAGLHASALN